jgi:hypothetical protein
MCACDVMCCALLCAVSSRFNQLSGFYSNESGNDLSFVALALYEGRLDAVVKELQAQFDALLRAPPKASTGPGTGGTTPAAGGGSGSAASKIISRADAITLEHLREQALLTHYQTQVRLHLVCLCAPTLEALIGALLSLFSFQALQANNFLS